MLFNSLDFAVFLPVFFLLYWGVFRGRTKEQNVLVVVASYVFYGWWDWRFLGLIAFSTLIDFSIGLRLKSENSTYRRRGWLWLSLIVNLGLLGFFKYYNFFLDNFVAAFLLFGTPLEAEGLKVVLPVGISFYTFQTLSYTIDVYRRKLEPTRDLVAFSAFVSFFPQLVAGPIERATHLLPQFYRRRYFDYQQALDGTRQIVWGFFKKVVIADNCAEIANMIFNSSDDFSGSTLALGASFFALQIYGDFSGYSDIAIGTARIFGFDLMQNFAFPYFSRDIAEFWRRWHISLSTWFRDYVYIPLGGSRGGTWMRVRNTFIVFAVSGFWHGANWTFVIWGLLNAMYFLPLLLTEANRSHLEIVAKNRFFPSVIDLGKMGVTFGLTVVAWIFFRAENLSHAYRYIYEMFSGLTEVQPYRQTARILLNQVGVPLLLTYLSFFLIEWLGREKQYALQAIDHWNGRLQWTVLVFVTTWMLLTMSTGQNEFIYFQF